MTFGLGLVDVQHVDVLKGVRSERYILSSNWFRPVSRPLSVVHGPATFARLVHEDHVGHPRGWDQMETLIRVLDLKLDGVVQVPHHVHTDINVLSMHRLLDNFSCFRDSFVVPFASLPEERRLIGISAVFCNRAHLGIDYTIFVGSELKFHCLDCGLEQTH